MFVSLRAIETSKWKLVKIERIWEINSIWTFNVENDQELIISSINMIKWEIWNNFETRLNESIKTQYNIFHSDITATKKWKWVFIEVKKANINTFNTDCYYKKEQVYSLPLHFDDSWILSKKKSLNYFQIYDGIYYDLEKKLFIKWDKQLIIKDDNEKLFIDFLVKNYPNTVEKEDLMNYIYKDIIKQKYESRWYDINYNDINNEYLLPLKRKFIDKYTYALWIEKEIFNNKILIAPKNQWYSIKWKFITEI